MTQGSFPMNSAEARDITARINSKVEQLGEVETQLWELLSQAHAGKAWVALGYSGWSQYVGEELTVGRSHAYRLLDYAKVVEAFREVSPVGDTSTLTERQARNIKPVLGQARADIEEAIAAGEEPNQAVKDAIDKYGSRPVKYYEPTPAEFDARSEHVKMDMLSDAAAFAFDDPTNHLVKVVKLVRDAVDLWQEYDDPPSRMDAIHGCRTLEYYAEAMERMAGNLMEVRERILAYLARQGVGNG